ncbi:MAG: hypothetical protein ACI9XU_001504 [Arenicella sp.]|jgi:hypothetical protein
MEIAQMINKTPEKAISKRLVLGCGALVHDMLALIKQNPVLQEAITLHCLPAKLHTTPQLIAPEVDRFLAKHSHKYDDIFVAYADCGTVGELDKVLEKYQAQRMPGAHCYEFFSGVDTYQDMVDEEVGSFFLTDYLVKNFDRLVVKGLGLDRFPELFDEYFKHYKRMIYIAQTQDPKLQQLAAQHAQSFGLEYVYRYVGIQGLSPMLDAAPNSKFAVEVMHNNTKKAEIVNVSS